MGVMSRRVVAFFLLAGASRTPAPAQGVQSFVGTVVSVRAEAGEAEVRPDNGGSRVVKLGSGTLLQKVAPGESDLKKAAAIQARDIASGDRVLVSLEPGSANARRIVVMPVADITKRNQADQQDWIDRGISGVVTGKNGNEIKLAIKSPGAEKAATVTLTERTTYRRYAPDSVKFAEAKASTAGEIQIGDQLRARGQKNAEAASVTAENVVFGTFLTKTGSVVSVDPANKEIRIAELGTGTPLVVKLTTDTQVKAVPDFPATFNGTPPAFRGERGPGGDGGPPVFGDGRGGGAGAFGGGRPDPAQMIERLPLASVDAVKPGQSIIVSSTKGTRPDELTAIVVVANAQTLIQMATVASGGRGGQNQRGQDQAAGLAPGPISSGGLGFDLSGMIP
jgi:hypothetical protein